MQWFRNYLSDRYQCVKINNSTSTPLVRIHAGVPQGAILSPRLFIIYMNNIASLSVQDQTSFTNLSANDTSLYVANGDPTILATELQQAVDNLSEWFDNWLLNVNIEKTALLILELRKKGILMPAIHITVRIRGDVIHQVNQHKHLGLILNSTLTWKDHVDNVCSKAAQTIGLLHRIRERLSAPAGYTISILDMRETCTRICPTGLVRTLSPGHKSLRTPSKTSCTRHHWRKTMVQHWYMS